MKQPLSRATVSLLMLVAEPLVTTRLHAQAPIFDWAKPLPRYGYPRDVVADPAGNALVAFSSLRSSEAEPSSVQRSNVVAKVNTRGEEVWSQRWLPNIRKLATDAQGSAYVAGSLFVLGASTQPLATTYFDNLGISTEGSGSAYVAKFSPSGNLEWVRRFGGIRGIVASELAVDRNNNYYVGGLYTQTSAQIGETTLLRPTLETAVNLFVAKYAPNGQPVWVQVGVGSYWAPNVTALALDASGNVVVAGHSIEEPYSFEGGLTTSGRDFLVKFSKEGKVLWTTDLDSSTQRVAIDQDGNIFLAYGVGSDVLVLNKYGPGGDLLRSLETQVLPVEGFFASADNPRVAVDSEGNCFLYAPFHGEISFNSAKVSTTGNYDTFVTKYDRQGNVRWVIQSQGLTFDKSDTRPGFLSVAPGGVMYFSCIVANSVRFGDTTLRGTSQLNGLTVLARILDPDTVRPPLLSVGKVGDELSIRWPAQPAGGFVLESGDSLSTGSWKAVSATPVVEGDHNVVTIQARTTGGNAQFFRLRKP